MENTFTELTPAQMEIKNWWLQPIEGVKQNHGSFNTELYKRFQDEVNEPVFYPVKNLNTSNK